MPWESSTFCSLSVSTVTVVTVFPFAVESFAVPAEYSLPLTMTGAPSLLLADIADHLAKYSFAPVSVVTMAVTAEPEKPVVVYQPPKTKPVFVGVGSVAPVP